MLDYASTVANVIKRVDARKDIEARDALTAKTPRLKVAPAALADLKIMRASMERLREAVRVAPGNGPAVVAAVNSFGEDGAYVAADERVTSYRLDTCKNP